MPRKPSKTKSYHFNILIVGIFVTSVSVLAQRPWQSSYDFFHERLVDVHDLPMINERVSKAVTASFPTA
eukprot:scaffold363151_cov15-Prasinocladus_malaysianus.AAC.1